MAVHVLERRSPVRTRSRPLDLVYKVLELDLLLLGVTAVLTALGVILVYSASRSIYGSYFLKHQIIYAVLGVVVMIVFTAVDYRLIEQWGYWFYGASLLALAVVLSPLGKSATSTGGTQQAQRWIELGPVQLQPSEFAVLGLVFAISCYVARRDRELGARDVVALLGLAAPPMLLVVEQPDLGTGIVMGVVLALMLVIAGIRLRYLAALVGIVLVGFLAADALHLLNGYQVTRLTCFLHQNSTAKQWAVCSYNLVEAKTAIGAGGLTGVGLLNGAVTNLGYVPVQYADFVFSALGEQFGFFGSAALILLFCLLLYRIVRAMQGARDVTGRLVCAGVLAFFAFSIFQNIGMNIGIMPITGIPLPFESYGGSALLAFYAGIGVVHNVELRRGSRR